MNVNSSQRNQAYQPPAPLKCIVSQTKTPYEAAERAAISGAVALGVTADHCFDRTGSHEAISDGTAGAHRGSAGSDHGRSIGTDVNRGYPLLEQTIKIF